MRKNLPIILSVLVPTLALAAIQYIPTFRPVYRWMAHHDAITLGIVVLCAMPFGFMAYNRILASQFNRPIR